MGCSVTARVPNWEIELTNFAVGEVGRPFIWGETNCVSLALRAFDSYLGTEFHKRWRHYMSTATRAAAFSRSEGLDGIVERLRSVGMQVVRPNFERTGDVRFCMTDDTIGASVLLGRQCLSSTVLEGVQLFDYRALESSVVIGVR